MKIVVITPFNRFNNLKVMSDHLADKGIEWHAIVDYEMNLFTEPWQKEIVVGKQIKNKNNNMGNAVINRYLERGLEPNTYYHVLSDDDFVEEDYYQKIRCMKPKADVIVTSMKRGHHECHTHPINTLFASPSEMHECGVGAEQLLVKGSVFSEYRLDENSLFADGEFARKLKQDGRSILYLPNCYVLFNYLEEGRWNAVR